jgi:SpoVK/Ycf46/Vps4 family AAA+-type ATPase
MRIVQALAGRDAFFVATANRLDSVPPELRRRYKYGIWFSDLPTQEERAEIWRIHLKANGFGFEKNQPEIHAVREWTGAEIRNACELAARLGITPADATGYIVPVSQSDPEGIERLRKAAEGRFLSVSYPGPYRRAGEEQKPRGRRLTNAVR